MSICSELVATRYLNSEQHVCSTCTVIDAFRVRKRNVVVYRAGGMLVVLEDTTEILHRRLRSSMLDRDSGSDVCGYLVSSLYYCSLL